MLAVKPRCHPRMSQFLPDPQISTIIPCKLGQERCDMSWIDKGKLWRPEVKPEAIENKVSLIWIGIIPMKSFLMWAPLLAGRSGFCALFSGHQNPR